MRARLAGHRIGKRRALFGMGAAVAAAGLAACSSSPSASSSSTTGAGSASANSSSSSSSSSPGTEFATANVSGLGMVVVDGRGRTVYVLTSDGKTNLPCTDGSGCTKYWPDLPLPDGTSAAKAGSGIQSALLSTMKLSDGETYPTYHGWLMYEYSGDTASGHASGQLVKSFGGTWYALSPSGSLITTAAGSSGGSSGSGGYGGY